jgi:U3 small nucleolar RNA-associated protein 5
MGRLDWLLIVMRVCFLQIPSLPVHLASLSQLLQSRLQLHTPLLSLSGRLDLALAQIELRKSLVPPKPKRQGTFYVEGESETDDDEEDSDEDEDMDSDVEIEGDEEDIGEVEDVRLESRRETESRSAGGDEDEADGEIRVRALNGRGKGKAAREVLVASDDE